MPVQIMEGQDVYTVIVQYNVPAEKGQDLLEAIRPFSEALAARPGFVTASVHVSEDGARILNYQQWEDEESFALANVSDEVAGTLAAVREFNPDVRHYELAFVVDAGASSG